MKKILISIFVLLLSLTLVSAEELVCDESSFFDIQSGEQTFEETTISIIEITSSNEITLEVDGVQGTIAKGDTSEINGVTFFIEDLFKRTEVSESAASLTIVCEEPTVLDLPEESEETTEEEKVEETLPEESLEETQPEGTTEESHQDEEDIIPKKSNKTIWIILIALIAGIGIGLLLKKK
jgi:hypothetical protein